MQIFLFIYVFFYFLRKIFIVSALRSFGIPQLMGKGQHERCWTRPKTHNPHHSPYSCQLSTNIKWKKRCKHASSRKTKHVLQIICTSLCFSRYSIKNDRATCQYLKNVKKKTRTRWRFPLHDDFRRHGNLRLWWMWTCVSNTTSQTPRWHKRRSNSEYSSWISQPTENFGEKRRWCIYLEDRDASWFKPNHWVW